MGGSPLIGITTYGPDVLAPGGLPVHSLPQAYSDAVAAAGGIPVLLGASIPANEAILARVDALLIAGGGDLDPATYGGGEHETVYMVNPARDAFELAVTERALAREDLPVLGICRGMQVLNVALGGDLELHLPDVYGDEVRHRLPPREPTLHGVRVAPGSVLQEIYGRGEFPVCSWHHQCVRKLGRGLVPVAWASDGVIEAFVYEPRAWVIGIQWHAEMQVEDDPLQRRLFDALVRSARCG
ncbi:MAG: gamma-glutamyl-gamma-aminobutyrate hydrolase family protein [Myxococcota bacterium]